MIYHICFISLLQSGEPLLRLRLGPCGGRHARGSPGACAGALRPGATEGTGDGPDMVGDRGGKDRERIGKGWGNGGFLSHGTPPKKKKYIPKSKDFDTKSW